jgi:hypothetical protein
MLQILDPKLKWDNGKYTGNSSFVRVAWKDTPGSWKSFRDDRNIRH